MENNNLSEIEKIQAEIERDFEKLYAPVLPPKEETETEENIFIESMNEALPAESFYTETIKVESEPPAVTRPRRPWGRTAAILCLICTLGTACLGFGIGTAGVYARYHWFGGAENYNNETVAAYGISAVQYAFDDITAIPGEGTLSDMIKRVEPSVVSVSATFDASGPYGFGPRISEGSGIIFFEDRNRVYIATNNHVVGGAREAHVSISGSDPIKAHPVGSDPDADLQVIYVEKRDLRVVGIHHVVIALFGDSDLMEVGDVVLAIGNAMGEGNSATRGIVSAKERTITVEGRRLTMLQTDAAINQGNSGGPLINTRGEVIGINTAKFSSDGFFSPMVEGMGYSISSNIAKPILEDLMNRSSRPALGIYGQTVTDEMVDDMELDIPPLGVYVNEIIRNSGAERAGLERTDIITGFNDRPILTMEQLIDEIRQSAIGETVQIKVLRRGKDVLTLDVTLGEMNIDNF
jgi:serine protease Do